MLAPNTLKPIIAAAAVLCAALPATADTITWATWSSPVTGATSGSANATFAGTGVTGRYTGELQQFVANYPSYTPVATFRGGSVDNTPPTANGILRIFGGAAAGTHTLTFSQAVQNPVFAIWSLGQPGLPAQFNFDQAFTIQSGGANAEFGGVSITAAGNNVLGSEGNGVIRFNGSPSSFSWTNPVVENWYGFTVGVAAVTVIPEPETYALLLAGLGLVAGVARRRRPG